MSNSERTYPSNPAIEHIFIGHVADAPELKRHGDTKVTKFVLIDNVYAGKDDAGNAVSVPLSIQFTAFNQRAETIANNVCKGDQLIVTYTMRNSNKDNVEPFGFEFIVQSFRFGAPGAVKRKELEARASA